MDTAYSMGSSRNLASARPEGKCLCLEMHCTCFNEQNTAIKSTFVKYVARVLTENFAIQDM